jgi:CobQ-like glutamine amidotransferase family enzyme
MNQVPTTLKIAHLYAQLLNIYGDRGNILTLQKRAQWRGIEVEIEAIAPGLRQFDPDKYDLFFIGGGQDKQQELVAQDLQVLAPSIAKAVDGGSVILAICGGYQLLGHYYRPHQGPELKGISLIDAYTVAGNKRMIGNVVIRRPDGTSLVGFENHSGKTYLGKEVQGLGKVITGGGNNGEDGIEGAQYRTIFGTYLHGSLLPKNPIFADFLISTALKRRYPDIQLSTLDDTFENKAHQTASSFKA